MADYNDDITCKAALNLPVFTQTVLFSDLGSGASDTIAIAGLPTNILILGVAIEIDTAFAGEADLAVAFGDTADPDELIAAFTLDSVAAGWAKVVAGVELLPHFEPDYVTDGAALTFTATELDDVTAGQMKIHVFYATPVLT